MTTATLLAPVPIHCFAGGFLQESLGFPYWFVVAFPLDEKLNCLFISVDSVPYEALYFVLLVILIGGHIV